MRLAAKVKSIGSIRQLVYPKEFRIPAPTWPLELSSILQKLAELPQQTGDSHPQNVDGAEEESRMRFLAELGTGLWRLKQKMIERGTDRPREEMRRAYRHLESVWDTLVEAGVEIQDHTDAPIDSGMQLKVLAFQPTPGIERRRVLDTIKPSVYFRKKTIQIGEVIVATPGEVSEQKTPSGLASG